MSRKTLRAVSASTSTLRFGDELDVGRLVVDAGLLQRGADASTRSDASVMTSKPSPVSVDLFGAGLEHGEHDVVFGRALGRRRR